jgi:hypothetical protein
VCVGKSLRPLVVRRRHTPMETSAIKCLHEPFYTTPQYVPLPLPQVLSFYYVQGSHLHIVVFTCTVLTRDGPAPQHKLEKRDARGCTGACDPGPVTV